MAKYLSLNNTEQIEYYDFYLTKTSCIFKFFDSDYSTIAVFFGDDIIKNCTLYDDETSIKTSYSLVMKLKSIQSENGSITIKKNTIIKEGYFTEENLVDTETGEEIVDEDGNRVVQKVFHPAEIESEKITKNGAIITVTLENASINDRINSLSKKANKYDLSYDVVSTLAQNLSDDDATKFIDIYPLFIDLATQNFVAKDEGYKCVYNGELYKTTTDNVPFIVDKNQESETMTLSLTDNYENDIPVYGIINNPNFKKISVDKAVI